MNSSRRHQPGVIHLHLFKQDQIWIDRYGYEHKIENMERGHVGNVILMLRDSAVTLYSVYSTQIALNLLIENTPENAAEAMALKDPEYDNPYHIADLGDASIEKFESVLGGPISARERQLFYRSFAWLESTPLMYSLLNKWGPEPVAWTPHNRSKD